MLNEQMQLDLIKRVTTALKNVDGALTKLPYENAVAMAAMTAVGVFTDYVDFNEEEVESITETLSILADKETMEAIAKAQEEIDNGEYYPLDSVFNLDELLDDGSVVWYDSAEEAMAANE